MGVYTEVANTVAQPGQRWQPLRRLPEGQPPPAGTESYHAGAGVGAGAHGHRLPVNDVADADTVALVGMESGYRRWPRPARTYSGGMGVSTKTGISRVVFAW